MPPKECHYVSNHIYYLKNYSNLVRSYFQRFSSEIMLMVSSRKMKHDHSSVDLKIHLKENRNEKMKKNMAKKKKVTNRRKVA